MSDILPFRAIRYKSTKFEQLICPPYDIINEQERQRLFSLSKYNFVRIESPTPIGVSHRADKLSASKASRTFKEWLKSGILIRDKKPAYYVYTQEFTLGNKRIKRTGFFAALKLEKKNVYNHEKISQKPILGRLELLRKTKANVSPVFCLFCDKKGEVSGILKKLTHPKRLLPLLNGEKVGVRGISFEDNENIRHTIFPVTDDKMIKKISKDFKGKKIMIADGHHRYYTSLVYRDEIKSGTSPFDKGGQKGDLNYILTYLCPLEDPGVVVMPTHRVVRSTPGIKEKLEKTFNLTFWNGKGKPLIVAYYNGCFHQMKFKNKSLMKKFSRYTEIPSLILSKTVLSETSPDEITYTHNIQEAVQLAQEMCGYAFLLSPPSLRTVYKFSLAGEIMPAKTTYFYPKIPAGLVVYG
ncbi:MAG: DUF1015 domain-containing protein [Elusimicrobiota bacterium]